MHETRNVQLDTFYLNFTHLRITVLEAYLLMNIIFICLTLVEFSIALCTPNRNTKARNEEKRRENNTENQSSPPADGHSDNIQQMDNTEVNAEKTSEESVEKVQQRHFIDAIAIVLLPSMYGIALIIFYAVCYSNVNHW